MTKKRATVGKRSRREPVFLFVPERLGAAIRKNAILREAAKTASTARFGRVYLVGGSVRDIVMERGGSDADLAVERNVKGFMEEMRRRVGGALFLMDSDTDTYRIVNKRGFTVDASRFKGRNIREDLKKRDFTVNAVCFDVSGKEIEILDPFKGLRDISAGTLAPVSLRIFDDDPLRLLRAYRFTVTHGFGQGASLKALIKKKAVLVGNASGERKRDELVKMFSEPGASAAIREMFSTGVMEALAPELAAWGKLRGYDIIGHSLSVMDKADEFISSDKFARAGTKLGKFFTSEFTPGISGASVFRLAAFLHDAGKPLTMKRESGRLRFIGHDRVGEKLVKGLLKRLCFPSKVVRAVAALTREHHRTFVYADIKKPSNRVKAHFIKAAEVKGIQDAPLMLLGLALCDARATRGSESSGLKRAVAGFFKFNASVRTKSVKPLFSGKDVMRLFAIEEGPLVGAVLREVERAVMAGDVTGKRDAAAYVRKWLGERGSSRG